MSRPHFTEFDATTGNILRFGTYQTNRTPRPRRGHAIALIQPHPNAAKIEHDGLNDTSRIASNPRATGIRKRREPPKPPAPPERTIEERLTALEEALKGRL